MSTRRMATDSNLFSRLSVGQNERKQIQVQQKQNKDGGKAERGGKEGPVSVLARYLFTFSFPSSRVTGNWKRLGIHLQSNVNITRFFCCHIRTRTLQIRLSFIML